MCSQILTHSTVVSNCVRPRSTPSLTLFLRSLFFYSACKFRIMINPRIYLMINFSVHLYQFKSSWRTGSKVYPTPGSCSLLSQPFHWRRAPVASLEVFLLRSTQSEWFCSNQTTVCTQLPPSPVHFSALLPLANSWISIAVLVDVSITYVSPTCALEYRVYTFFSLSLFYFLRRSKTGFKSERFPLSR